MRYQQSSKEKPTTSVKRLLIIGMLAALGAGALRAFIFGLYVVPSSSMVPTLLTGDYIFATKYPYGYSSAGSFAGLIKMEGRIGGKPPQRGEVVVFKSPANDGIILVKRLIGLPGDTIQMIRSQLYINGTLIRRERLPAPLAFPGDDEPTDDYVDYAEYLSDNIVHAVRLLRDMEDEETINNTPTITVPEHFYFFMGDNRDRSDDSRVSNIGFVPEENLIARAEMTFFSMSKDAHLWEFSKWPWAIRWHRVFVKIL